MTKKTKTNGCLWEQFHVDFKAYSTYANKLGRFIEVKQEKLYSDM